MVWLPKVVILASVGLFISCSAPRSPPANVDGKSQSNICISPAVYDNAASKYICSQYWSNKDTACDQKMRDVLVSRRQSITPSTICGNSNTQSAVTPSASRSCVSPSVYDNAASKYICSQYWTNKDTACDQKMQEILSARNQIVSPSSECGVSKLAPPSSISPQVCAVTSFTKYSTVELCDVFHASKNISCDSKIRQELDSRRLVVDPKDKCGSQNADSPVQQKPNSPTKQEYMLPTTVVASCKKIINNFIDNTTPIVAACNFRYKSAIPESITCRKAVNEFISLNSKGVGTTSRNCGLQD